LSGCCEPPFTASCAVGVFSSGDDVEPLAEVRGAGFGSGYNPPRDAIPHVGKVRADNVEASPEMPGDVFQEDESGSKYANGVCDPGPEVSGVFGAKSFTCIREGLARIHG
jgi:hypothetical protein